MTAEAAAVVHSFRVGSRICTLTIPRPKPGEACCIAMEWAPDLPSRLSEAEWRQYREGRNTAVAQLCRLMGERAIILEV